MKTIPTVGSKIKVNCQFYTGEVTFEGVVIKPYKWLQEEEFCLQTGKKEFPVSVINLKSIVNLEILTGSTSKIRTFTVKGSKNYEYTVTLSNEHYSCSCIGFKYHNKCKHVAEVQQKLLDNSGKV